MLKMFLVVPPGLEDLAKTEIADEMQNKKLVYQPLQEELTFEVDLQNLLNANIHLRIPNRILIRLGDFRATNFPELVKKASRLNWEDYLSPNTSISIRTTCKKSKLYHSDAVSQRIHSAIQDRIHQKVNLQKINLEDESENNVQIIVVRIIDDQVEISIDSSGTPLYKRGYRLAVTKAPLRENLAAAMLLASKWNRQDALIDPFCGSGTIPIEAALMKKNLPPGNSRNFIMEQWPIFKKKMKILTRFQLVENTSVGEINIFGSDRDAGAIKISGENCQRANVSGTIQWSINAISDMPRFSQPGWIVTNPPYGERISANTDLRNLYAQFGNILRKEYAGWKVLFLCSDPNLIYQTQLDVKPIIHFSNGGINVKGYFSEKI